MWGNATEWQQVGVLPDRHDTDVEAEKLTQGELEVGLY